MARVLVDRPVAADVVHRHRNLVAGMVKPLYRLAAAVDCLLMVAVVWRSRLAERQVLRRLDDEELRHLDISPEWREKESRKPFWRP